MNIDRETDSGPEALRRRMSEEHVGVYGYGRTGRALVRALRPHAKRLTVFEDSPGDSTPPSGEGVEWVVDPDRLSSSVERLIVSPGVPWDHERLQQARDRGLPVWAEVELAYRFSEGRIWAVTGTNAKSTCSELAGCLLRASAGGSVEVCGNRGRPFVEAAVKNAASRYVVEISTFQVEGMEAFRPGATLLTNLGDDHRDRHGSLKRYHDLKWELVQRTEPGGHVALFREDRQIRRRAGGLRDLETRWFRRDSVPGRPWSWNKQGLRVGDRRLERDRLPFFLQLFPENLMAVLAWVGEELSPEEIVRGLDAFTPLPHRARRIRLDNGARVIEDSKGTNPHAVQALVERLEGPLRLVLGGGGKGADFSPLISLLSDREVRSLVLAGEDPTVGEIVDLCDEHDLPHRRDPDWEHAVKASVKATQSGETLVLSPGGNSFDAFEDYRQRGESFQRWVREAAPS